MTPRALRRAAEHKLRKQAAKAARLQPASAEPESESESLFESRIPATSSTDIPCTAAVPLSAAQLAANQANAQRSTGPVTATGKNRSSQNATTHALTGRTVLLPYEDAAAYQQRLAELADKYNPANDDERLLIQTMLDCEWRLTRVQHLEAAVLLKGHVEFADKYEDRSPNERAHLIQAEAYLKYEKQIRNLNIQESRLRRVLDKSRLELSRTQAARRQQQAAEAAISSRSQARSHKPGASPTKLQPSNGFVFADSQDSNFDSDPTAPADERSASA